MATKRTRLYAMYLRLLGDSVVSANIDLVLRAIGEAIAASESRMDALDHDVNSEYLDAVVDDETDVIENLLGASFVVCQTYISAVVSRVDALHSLYKGQHGGAELTTTSTRKRDIMGFGSPRVRGSIFTEVQVIDAFANYFKHRDEWTGKWCKLREPSAATARIIQAVGASWGSTGNLRTGAKVLRNESYADVVLFADILRRWLRSVHDAYREELEMNGLL
jgi:hypothetical protein